MQNMPLLITSMLHLKSTAFDELATATSAKRTQQEIENHQIKSLKLRRTYICNYKCLLILLTQCFIGPWRFNNF